MEPNKVKIYGCGGAGINVAKFFEGYRNRKDPGFASIDAVYIDTSKSNLAEGAASDAIYKIKDMVGNEKDGSGKVRAENATPIAEHVRDILLTHAPADLNIVVSSGGGGSGSVIAPSLMSELLRRGIPTVAIIIGCTDSILEIKNTVNTLKSYESVAKVREMPVAGIYFENSEKTNRRTVNADINAAIVYLASLFSGQNRELDSADLKNWLNFPKVTTYQNQLAALEFFHEVVNVEKPQSAIAVATITTDDTSISTNIGVPVDYQCVGYATKSSIDLMKVTLPFHAVLVDGYYTKVYHRLDQLLKSAAEAASARVGNNSILSKTDKVEDNGIIL